MSSGKSAENNVCPGPSASPSNISAQPHLADNVTCSDVLFTEGAEMSTHHPWCWLDRWGGSYPQQIFSGSMCIANPPFKEQPEPQDAEVGTGAVSSPWEVSLALIFAAKSFLKENFWRGFAAAGGRGHTQANPNCWHCASAKVLLVHS